MIEGMTWAERIDRAERVGRFTAKDFELVSDFQTCAVGEAHPEFDAGEHFSQELYDLGMEFVSAVTLTEIERARKLLARIEAIG